MGNTSRNNLKSRKTILAGEFSVLQRINSTNSIRPGKKAIGTIPRQLVFPPIVFFSPSFPAHPLQQDLSPIRPCNQVRENFPGILNRARPRPHVHIRRRAEMNQERPFSVRRQRQPRRALRIEIRAPPASRAPLAPQNLTVKRLSFGN